ncbi:MAG TPA: GNAT family N-acetyltransferase [Streptosporangiaceae bacterium]|nr:GNAT family N-acetyltransferase [Streptosporangiaceae bacterium]
MESDCRLGAAPEVVPFDARSGLPVHIRRAVAGDRPALTEMLTRCSDQTRARRFHKFVRSFPEPYLTDALAEQAAHFALLAQADNGVVALASCVTDGPGRAEFAVLIEDIWQRAGLGTRLMNLLVAHADHNGIGKLTAEVHASQAWVLPVLGGYGTCEAWLRRDVFEVTVHRDSP